MATLTKRSGSKRSSTRSRSSAKTARTAPRGETEVQHRARMDRIAAERRTAAQHSEHPEKVADPTVRHAEPQTGKQRGEGAGGFPAGEYDVTAPAKASESAPATEGVKAGKTADTSHDALIDAHLGDKDIELLQKQLGDNRRLDDSELPLILEALPVGAIVEHEAENRWRVRSPASGGIRWGHGATAVHAIEAYVLGETASTEPAAAAQRFLSLPTSVQKEIQERDRIAAERTGGTDSNQFARDEAVKAAQSDATADAPAANAVTDGPEKASARAKQSKKGAQNTPQKSAAKSASKSGSKRSGRKR